MRSLSLRPKHSRAFPEKALSMGFETPLSRRLAIQATGRWLLS